MKYIYSFLLYPLWILITFKLSFKLLNSIGYNFFILVVYMVPYLISFIFSYIILKKLPITIFISFISFIFTVIAYIGFAPDI